MATKTTASGKAGTTLVKRYDGRTVRQPEALAFLMKQHREVEGYFDAYEDADSDEEKTDLVRKICLALAVHAKIEEELLYPPAEDAIQDPDLVDEAWVEHATAKDLISQLETMKVGDPFYDAKVKVLGEYITHHVKEEETELFPQCVASDLDLQGIGDKLEARSAALTRELSGKDGPAKIAADARAGAHI